MSIPGEDRYILACEELNSNPAKALVHAVLALVEVQQAKLAISAQIATACTQSLEIQQAELARAIRTDAMCVQMASAQLGQLSTLTGTPPPQATTRFPSQAMTEEELEALGILPFAGYDGRGA